MLDSPLPLGIAAEARAEQKVKGQQAALNAFAAQCVASACALGPDPKGAIDAMLAGARQGTGPGGASVAALTDAIATALAFPRGDFVSLDQCAGQPPSPRPAAATSPDSTR